MKRGPLNHRCRFRRYFRKPGFIDRENITGAYNHGPFNYVLQLSDNAWPVIGLKELERLLVDCPYILACPACVTLNEIFEQHQDVVLTLSERRHFDGKYI